MLMEEEMEALKRKYDEMVREHENTYRHQKQHLEDVYKKVLLNQSLAEEFRAKFIEHRTVPSASPSTSATSHCMLPFFYFGGGDSFIYLKNLEITYLYLCFVNFTNLPNLLTFIL